MYTFYFLSVYLFYLYTYQIKRKRNLPFALVTVTNALISVHVFCFVDIVAFKLFVVFILLII